MEMEMDDFQLYRGILDMDGNSWSSRFGRLLCYNSVVLKVEPSWVDYFHFKESGDGEPKLQPWVHYIPVKADLSDLVEMSSFVLDPNNDGFLQNMLAQANSWCRRNMNRRSISIDVLNIWERYVDLLEVGDPDWSNNEWKAAKEEIFHPENPLLMDDTILGTK
jgi:Glycosyl transferase family 90